MDNWLTICDGIEANQMYFKHENGKKRRYIVVRKQTDIRSKSGRKLLFEDMPGYRYSCFVTNLDLPLDVVWNAYNTCADCENGIKKLKQDFGLEYFCLKDFWDTEASFRFIMVAYNIMSLFRHFALQSHKTSTLKTLKVSCFALGTRTVNHANRNCLEYKKKALA